MGGASWCWSWSWSWSRQISQSHIWSFYLACEELVKGSKSFVPLGIQSLGLHVNGISYVSQYFSISQFWSWSSYLSWPTWRGGGKHYGSHIERASQCYSSACPLPLRGTNKRALFWDALVSTCACLDQGQKNAKKLCPGYIDRNISSPHCKMSILSCLCIS